MRLEPRDVLLGRRHLRLLRFVLLAGLDGPQPCELALLLRGVQSPRKALAGLLRLVENSARGLELVLEGAELANVHLNLLLECVVNDGELLNLRLCHRILALEQLGDLLLLLDLRREAADLLVAGRHELGELVRPRLLVRLQDANLLLEAAVLVLSLGLADARRLNARVDGADALLERLHELLSVVFVAQREGLDLEGILLPLLLECLLQCGALGELLLGAVAELLRGVAVAGGGGEGSLGGHVGGFALLLELDLCEEALRNGAHSC